MDRDEMLISIASSFIDIDVSNMVIYISYLDDNNFSATFPISNDSTYVAGKKLVNEEEINVSIDLVNENIGVYKIKRSGCVDEHGNNKNKNIFSEMEINNYSVVREEDNTYLDCTTFFSTALEISCETTYGNREHNYYDDKKIGQTRIIVNKEYSILDGYPVNSNIKSFVKACYK